MADNKVDPNSDIISSESESTSERVTFNYDNSREIQYLMSIDENVKRLVRNGQMASQSNARNMGNPYEDSQTSFRRMQGFRTERQQKGSFSDEFSRALWESVLGKDFKDKIGKAVSIFADSLGVELRDLPGTLGKYMGEATVSLFKSTNLGKAFYGQLDRIKTTTASQFKDTFESAYKRTTGQDSPWKQAYQKSQSYSTRSSADSVTDSDISSGLDRVISSSGVGIDTIIDALAANNATIDDSIDRVVSEMRRMDVLKRVLGSSQGFLKNATGALGDNSQLGKLFPSNPSSVDRIIQTINDAASNIVDAIHQIPGVPGAEAVQYKDKPATAVNPEPTETPPIEPKIESPARSVEEELKIVGKDVRSTLSTTLRSFSSGFSKGLDPWKDRLASWDEAWKDRRKDLASRASSPISRLQDRIRPEERDSEQPSGNILQRLFSDPRSTFTSIGDSIRSSVADRVESLGKRIESLGTPRQGHDTILSRVGGALSSLQDRLSGADEDDASKMTEALQMSTSEYLNFLSSRDVETQRSIIEEALARKASGEGFDESVPVTDLTEENIQKALEASGATEDDILEILKHISDSMKSSSEVSGQGGYPSSTSRDTSPFDSSSEASDMAENAVKDQVGDAVKDKALGSLSEGEFTAAETAEAVEGAETAEAAATAAEGLGTVAAESETAGVALEGSLAGGAAAGGEAVAALGPYALIAVAALIALDAAVELTKKALKYAFGPAIEGASEALKAMGKAANRRELTRKEFRELANDRYKEDIKAIVEEPFNILKDAAEKVEQAWDANLRTINATQGYSKADLQSLMATYADRLREDNLSAVVSGSDIINNLASVLQQGLSGEIANEFAYIATVLNAAIPTQDFFGYAGTYSSIAANAIKDGKSQSQAIRYANEQLESFAGSVLYASRELAGGFSTGLKNAQSLFEDAYKIAQASRTGEVSTIAGVLTSVSAIVGAIAPDLATSITDAVTKAATGGNSSDVVALRSLAGINASNTEFLKALARDPQRVFSDLFYNLASMFNDSDDAWMEKAEAYSQVFGLSMDAFARIDFHYLADAISKMRVDNSALTQNMDQLISGETTTNKELLRMQQANKYMIEEGLAYVLDNEAARAIQQHMWDEQIAQQICENEYAVELKGKALEFLDGLRTTVERIMNILNPIAWLAKAATNLVGTASELYGQEKDIVRILEAGKVGEGNSLDLYNLTHRGKDLQLTPNYAELLTGYSSYARASRTRSAIDNTLHALDSFVSPMSTIVTTLDIYQHTARDIARISSEAAIASRAIVRSLQSAESTFNSENSIYNWDMVSKSSARDISKSLAYLAGVNAISYTSSSASYVSHQQEDPYTSRLNKFLSVAEDSLATMYDENGNYVYDDTNDILKYRSYEAWEEAILKRSNIRNLKDFLEYGMDQSQVNAIQKQLKESFANAQTAAGGQEEYAEREDQRLLRKEQREFWTDHRAFWQETRDEWALVEEYRVWEKEFRGRQEQFWEDAKTAWANDLALDLVYFTQDLDDNITTHGKLDDVITLVTYGNSVLDAILSSNKGVSDTLDEFLLEWKKYFVLHEAYKNAYDSSDVEKIQREEKGEASTAVYRLAEALTNNDTELLDPVMQTNALLSQILLVAQAIMQQNNSTTGGNASLFSSLQATALGLVKTE